MKPSHVFWLLAVVAVWGINFVFVKVALEEVPPLFLCFCRFFLLNLLGIFFLKPLSVPFKWVGLYGLVMFVLQFALMFLAMSSGISAGLGSILLQTQVFFSVLFGSVLFKEKIDQRQLFGGLISLLGIALVCMNLGAGATLPGVALVLCAAATWGSGSVIVKKMGNVETGSLLAWGSLVAWPPLIVLSLYFENSGPLLLNIHRFSWQTYISIVFITVGSTAFGFGSWNRLLQVYPLNVMAPFTLLVPVFGMMGSVIWLGEPLEVWKMFAGFFVVSGLCLNLFKTSTAALKERD